MSKGPFLFFSGVILANNSSWAGKSLTILVGGGGRMVGSVDNRGGTYSG